MEGFKSFQVRKFVPMFALMLQFLFGCQQPQSNTFSQNSPISKGKTSVEKSATDETAISFAVANLGSLPACTSARVGSFAYVKDENNFYTCESIGWVKQDVFKDEEETTSFVFSTIDVLPVCSGLKTDNIAYVKETKSFFVCDGSEWISQNLSVSTSSEFSIAVQSVSSLPSCSAARMNSIAYVKDEKTIYSCELSGWTAQDILPRNPMSDPNAAATLSALPVCNSIRAGILAFVKNEKKFYSCETSGWVAQQVNTLIESPKTFITDAVDDLEVCTSGILGSLAYVREDEQFYSCEGSGWTITSIISGDPMKVVGHWRFHVDSNAIDLSMDVSEGSFYGMINDIEIIKYANGTAAFYLSGIMIKQSSVISSEEASIEDSDDFSFSGFIPDASTVFNQAYKIHHSANHSLNIAIDLSTETPVFGAVIDSNNDLTDNDSYYKEFTLVDLLL